jgi:hypothetical protein
MEKAANIRTYEREELRATEETMTQTFTFVLKLH